MKRMRLVMALILATTLLATGAAAAQGSGPESIIGLTVLPSPVVAGDTVYLNWDMDLSGIGQPRFRVYIPSDWYNAGDWGTGTGVTVSGLGVITWSDYGTACAGVSIGGVSTICNEWVGDDTGEVIESIQLVFTVSASATAGANRPVRVTNTAGSGGTPNISTVYVTVNPVPTTRYIGDTDCGGNSPCDTGATALQDAYDALPAAGGTIYVYGAHASDGALVGAKNVTLMPFDGTSSLGGAAGCPTTLIETSGAGNLTVDGLTLDGASGACSAGITANGSGDLTVQNAVFTGWNDEGVLIFASDMVSIADNDFVDNPGGGADGVYVLGGDVTIENNVFENNGRWGVVVDGGVVTLRGNTFTSNGDYGYGWLGGGVLTAYANNLSENNSGGYQALVGDLDDAAKNWWGSHTDDGVGPTTDGATSFAAAWDARLGADVVGWAAGVGSASLGNAALSGGGANTGVIISFDRGSDNAPFANGVPPYANRLCSDFYDFYGIGGTWTVQLPVDTSTACINNVRNYEIAYVINDNSECATVDDPACWDRIPEAQITVSGNNFVITGVDLSGTHFVAGDENGADPTVVSLRSLTAGAASNWLPAALVAVIALGGVLALARKRR